MKEQILELLHWLPLASIAGLLIASSVMKLVKGKFMNNSAFIPSALTMSSIGIMSGSMVHHAHLINAFDPCMGYCATLLAIASYVYAKSGKLSENSVKSK